MWNKVWAALGEETREHLLRECYGIRRDPAFGPLLDRVAKIRRSRTDAIVRLDEARFSNYLRSALGQVTVHWVESTLLSILYRRHKASIEALHATMNWPAFDDASPDGDESDSADPSTSPSGGSHAIRSWYDPTDKQLGSARTAVEAAAASGPPDVWLLILTGLMLRGRTEGIRQSAERVLGAAIEAASATESSDRPSGAGGASASEALADPRVPEPSPPPANARNQSDAAAIPLAFGADGESAADAVAADAEAASLQASHAHRYTEVDRLLTEHLVAILLTSGVEGHEFEEAERVVSLFTSLTRARPASFFHRGVLHGVAGREFELEIPGANEGRRLWYAHGYLMGVERAAGPAATLAAFDRIKASGRLRLNATLVLTNELPVRSAIVEQLVRLGLEQGVPARLCEAAELDIEPPPPTTPSLLRWCFEGADATHAAERLKVAKWIRAFHEHDPESPPHLRDLAHAAVARAMRDLGRFDGVGTPHATAEPRLRIEHLLARLRIGNVAAVASYRPSDWRQRVAAIGSLQAELRSLADHDPLLPMLLALPAVFGHASERTPTRRGRAIDDLGRAIETMGSVATESPWFPLQRLAEIWRDALRTCSEDAAEVQAGTRGLVRSIDRVEVIPADLLLECVGNATIAAAEDGASELVSAFLSKHGLRQLMDSDAIDADSVGPEVAEVIRRHLEDSSLRVALPFAQQWRAARILFDAAFVPATPSVEAASAALDQMERIAHASPPHAAEWLCLLDGDERVARVLDEAETRWQARLSAREMLEQWDAAAEMVLHAAEAASRQGDRERVADLVAWLDERGHRGIVSDRLRQFAAPPAPRPAGAPAAKAPCRVLFIGGDERQAQAAHDIADRLRGSDPTLPVRFARIGWTSNWGREMPGRRSLIAEHDIVVLMTFIRTQCGRGLRAAIGEAGKQWRSCTGHGPQSMERAIRNAAAVVRGEG